jgi:hypothetical protein
MPENLLAQIRDFLGMSSGDFAREWKQLSPGDKADIKKGIEDGSLTY